MEMNAINVAWHKCFRRKPSFVDKKKWTDEISKFGELFTEEIQEIRDNAVPVTTKKLQSKFEIRLFCGANTLSFKLKYDRRDFTHS